MKEWWNFGVWRQWNIKVYKESLSSEHISDNGVEEVYEGLFQIDGENNILEVGIEKPEWRSIIKLEKNNQRFLLPTVFKQYLPLKPAEMFKCQLKKSDKKVWQFIKKPIQMNITPEKTQSFKEFIDGWNNVEHTSPQDFTFLKLVAIASKYKGVKMPRAAARSCPFEQY